MATWVMTRNRNGLRVRYKNGQTVQERLRDLVEARPPAAIADWILVNAQAGDVIVLSDGSQLQKLPVAQA